MSQAPLIGITTSITVGTAPERAYVNASYLRAVQAAGGIPVLLPPHLDERSRRELASRIDGLLLTGGGDVDPVLFEEERHETLFDVSGARDELEIALTLGTLERERPLLAICRGIQVLNVALGGSLHQDIPSDFGSAIEHSQKAPRDEATHAVTVSGETRLADILGAVDVRVNSMHHQAIKRVGKGLREVAWAPDGVIEGVERPDGNAMVVGVQWHPEELVRHDPAARGLFRALIAAAAR
jgi:putative glutamine amidotransferase